MDGSPNAQLNLMALAALNAIPVATYALWLDYFERRAAEERVSRDYEVGPDLQLLNAAGISTALALAIVFFATRPYRTEHPIASIAFFLGAIAAQTWLQARAAKRISPVGVKQDQDESPLARELNSSLWLGGMITAYLGFTALLALSLASVFHSLGATQALTALAGGAGALGGVILGLTFVYAIAPLTIRKVFPVRDMPPSELRLMIEKGFEQSKLDTPDIYIIRGDDLSAHNLMVAGFPKGRGIFRPAVFVFDALVRAANTGEKGFTPAELNAMILHEVSHASLNHLKKRLTTTCLSLPISVLVGSGAWMAAQLYLAPGVAELTQFVITLGVIVTPFRLVNQLIRKQEVEADLNAVIQFGADPQAMISALERLDRLNGRKSEIAHGAHPSTQERIRELQGLLPTNVVTFKKSEEKTEKTDTDQAA
jgi:Zn-dependent protease with chaperone function